MDSGERVMLMQQGRGGYAIARYDTLERRFFPFRAWSAIKTPYDTRTDDGTSY